MNSEIEARERTGYPPFGRLASLIVSAGDRPTAEGFARRLATLAPVDDKVQVLGPAEAPLAVIKGRYPLPPAGEVGRGYDPQPIARLLAAGPKTKGNLSSRSISIAELSVRALPASSVAFPKIPLNIAAISSRGISET